MEGPICRSGRRSSLIKELLEKCQMGSSDDRPCESVPRSSETACRQLLAARGTLKESVEHVNPTLQVALRKNDSGVPNRIRDFTGVACHHRNAARESLGEHSSELLLPARGRLTGGAEQIHRGQVAGYVVMRDIAENPHLISSSSRPPAQFTFAG